MTKYIQHLSMVETLDLLERNGVTVDLGKLKQWQKAKYDAEEAAQPTAEEGGE